MKSVASFKFFPNAPVASLQSLSVFARFSSFFYDNKKLVSTSMYLFPDI